VEICYPKLLLKHYSNITQTLPTTVCHLELQRLELCGGSLTDAGCNHLAKLVHLVCLSLAEVRDEVAIQIPICNIIILPNHIISMHGTQSWKSHVAQIWFTWCACHWQRRDGVALPSSGFQPCLAKLWLPTFCKSLLVLVLDMVTMQWRGWGMKA
jgi:hypothetical protein